MHAIRLTAWEQPARLVDVPTPEAGPGEVLIRVAGAGLCHSDLHLMHWPAGTLPYALPARSATRGGGSWPSRAPAPTAPSPARPCSSTGRGVAVAAPPAASEPRCCAPG